MTTPSPQWWNTICSDVPEAPSYDDDGPAIPHLEYDLMYLSDDQLAAPPKIDIFPPYIGIAMDEAHNGRFWFFPDDILAIDQVAPMTCVLTCRTITGQGFYPCFASAEAITAAVARCRKRAAHWKYQRDPVANRSLLKGYIDARRWLKRAGSEPVYFQNAPQDGRQFVTWLYQRGACWIAVWNNIDEPTETDAMLIGLPANPYIAKHILSMLNGAFVSDRQPHALSLPHVFGLWWD